MVSVVSRASETATEVFSVVELLEQMRSDTWRGPVEAIQKTYRNALEDLEDPNFRQSIVNDSLRSAEERGIKGDKAKQLAEQALENYPKKQIAPLKKELPAVMFSGVFSVRRADAIKNPSGLICADLDKLGTNLKELREKLWNDPHVFAVFVSPSGDGLKVLMRIPPGIENFRRAFDTIQVYFRTKYNVEIDPACSDISRLCFVSFDPLLRWNEGALPIPLLSDEELGANEVRTASKKHPDARRSDSKPVIRSVAKNNTSDRKTDKLVELDKKVVQRFLDDHTDDNDANKVVSALEYIDPSSENVWREVMMALKATWGEDAWELADEWSAHGGGYDERENDKRWESFDDDPDSGITLGTIFHYAKENGWQFHDKKAVILPTRSNSAFCRKVYEIIAPKNMLFLQGGDAVCIERVDAQPQIIAVDAIKGIRLFEQYIQFLKMVVNKDGDTNYIPVPLSEHNAKLLVKGIQPGELPELKGITRCPPLVATANGTGLTIAGHGYIPETGWFNASDDEMPDVSLAEAIESVRWLYGEFDFSTPGDRSRALVYPIGIALKLSGLLHGGFVPLDFGSANAQQSGKGTRQRITSALFGHRMEIITQSESHIGGTAESFKAACLAGKPFIQLDNFDNYSCREMEAFLTGETVMMRAAYGRSRSVDPSNFFVCISSNGLAARKDLAERTWFIRIEKKPEGYQFRPYKEGGIVAHVAKDQPYFLACIYSIIREWWRRGRKKTDETGHSFREFTQVCDWIAQNILDEAAVMEGHKEAAQLYGDAGKVFFSRIWDTLEKQGKLNHLFKATQLATMAFRFSIPVPGATGKALRDEEAAAKLIGTVAADLFSESDTLELGQGRVVLRTQGRPAPGIEEEDDRFSRHLPRGKEPFCYAFKSNEQITAANGGIPDSRQAVQVNVLTDWLEQFRSDVLAIVAEMGKPHPSTVSTAEIARHFQDGSVDSVGRWMAQLAQRWPDQFKNVRTEDSRGWLINQAAA